MIKDTAMSDTHAKFRGLRLSGLRELRSPEKGINNSGKTEGRSARVKPMRAT